MHGYPLTLWLTVGWLLVSAGVVTLLAFLLRLHWYSWSAIGAEPLARDHRISASSIAILVVVASIAQGGAYSQAAVPGPGGTRPGPGSIRTGTPYVAPTQNLTAVANALYAGAKSLSYMIGVAPGLTLTQPVTISIGFYSHFPREFNRITETYRDPHKPPFFLYNDREGDGKPRSLHMDITLTEPKPGGGIYSFAIPGDVWLDPLYDVKIDPLTFTLLQDCVSVGPVTPHTGIAFMWLPPDAQTIDRGKRLNFWSGGGKSNTIFEFAWARTEVSASANLHMPVFGFADYYAAPGLPAFGPWINLDSSQATPLVPGQTGTVKGGLKSDDGTCLGYFQYTITYQLRQYSRDQLGYRAR